jgi:hypothetical protein
MSVADGTFTSVSNLIPKALVPMISPIGAGQDWWDYQQNWVVYRHRT